MKASFFMTYFFLGMFQKWSNITLNFEKWCLAVPLLWKERVAKEASFCPTFIPNWKLILFLHLFALSRWVTHCRLLILSGFAKDFLFSFLSLFSLMSRLECRCCGRGWGVKKQTRWLHFREILVFSFFQRNLFFFS